MRPSLSVTSATALVVFSCAALADPGASASPSDLLVLAADAARTANYEGVVVYRDEDRIEAMRIVHRYQDAVERERITSLNGETREIYREDDRLVLLLPKDRVMKLDLPPPAIKGFLSRLTAERIESLKTWYDFQSAAQ
jgi:sigma-E factor negative regulatory protein RseB